MSFFQYPEGNTPDREFLGHPKHRGVEEIAGDWGTGLNRFDGSTLEVPDVLKYRADVWMDPGMEILLNSSQPPLPDFVIQNPRDYMLRHHRNLSMTGDVNDTRVGHNPLNKRAFQTFNDFSNFYPQYHYTAPHRGAGFATHRRQSTDTGVMSLMRNEDFNFQGGWIEWDADFNAGFVASAASTFFYSGVGGTAFQLRQNGNDQLLFHAFGQNYTYARTNAIYGRKVLRMEWDDVTAGGAEIRYLVDGEIVHTATAPTFAQPAPGEYTGFQIWFQYYTSNSDHCGQYVRNVTVHDSVNNVDTIWLDRHDGKWDAYPSFNDGTRKVTWVSDNDWIPQNSKRPSFGWNKYNTLSGFNGGTAYARNNAHEGEHGRNFTLPWLDWSAFLVVSPTRTGTFSSLTRRVGGDSAKTNTFYVTNGGGLYFTIGARVYKHDVNAFESTALLTDVSHDMTLYDGRPRIAFVTYSARDGRLKLFFDGVLLGDLVFPDLARPNTPRWEKSSIYTNRIGNKQNKMVGTQWAKTEMLSEGGITQAYGLFDRTLTTAEVADITNHYRRRVGLREPCRLR